MPPLPTADSSRDARRVRWRFPWGTAALVAVLALFVAGIVHLFELRFDVGDVYPPYSTLRSDPLGAKAFFESLAALPGLRVERSLRPLAALGTEPLRPVNYDNGEKTFTCFDLGADPEQWPFLLEPPAVERLEAIMRAGGRVVITFQPTTVVPTLARLSSLRAANEERGNPVLHQGPAARKLAEKRRLPDLTSRWGIDFRRRTTDDRPANAAAEFATPNPRLTARGGAGAAFAEGDEAVPWHSVVDFAPDNVIAFAARWHSVYERTGRPVMVARPFGTAGGELILVGDSYFLSNEGLRNDPSPAVLAALVGRGQRVIFDESHLEIREDPGLMTLARRYRLQGALAAVALLVALFVWRNVVSLVPLRGAGGEGLAGGETVLGRSADQGYLNLLRRSVAPGDLAGVCLAQWETSAGGGRARWALTARAVEQVREVVARENAQPARKRSPVASVYRAMCAAAKRKG